MPCDTVTQIEVAEHKMRREYFLEALKRMGLSYQEQKDTVYFGLNESYNFKTGKLKVQEGSVNSYKKAYSTVVVEKQFGKMGWKMKPNVTQQGKYVFTKR